MWFFYIIYFVDLIIFNELSLTETIRCNVQCCYRSEFKTKYIHIYIYRQKLNIRINFLKLNLSIINL